MIELIKLLNKDKEARIAYHSLLDSNSNKYIAFLTYLDSGIFIEAIINTPIKLENYLYKNQQT